MFCMLQGMLPASHLRLPITQAASNTAVFPEPFFPAKTFILGFNINFLFSNLL